MDLQALTEFFRWCTILAGGIYIYTAIVLVAAPDFVYRMQGKMFKLSRESFNVVIYAYLGFYKLVFIMFILVPYLALVIMT